MSTAIEPTTTARYGVGARVRVEEPQDDPDARGPVVVGVVEVVAVVFGEWDYLIRLPDGEPYHYNEDEIQGEAAAPPAAPAPVPAPAAGQAALVPMPLAWIEPDPDNERGSDLGDLTGLAESIRERGVREPILVYKVGDKRFRIQSGHRRWAAAAQLGLERIPAILVPPPPSAEDQVIDRLVVNLQRADLNPVEEARGYAALRAEGLTQAEIAAKVGKDQSRISRALGLLKQPEPIQQALAAGTLTPAHVEQLARIQEPALVYTSSEATPVEAVRAALAERAVRDGWSVRALEQTVDNHLSGQRSIRDYRKSEAERQERQAAANDRAAREPERTATLEREAAARAQAREAEALARQQRVEVAQTAIQAAVGWPATPDIVTADQLHLAALWLIEGSGAVPDERTLWQTWLTEAGDDRAALASVIARLAVARLRPDYDGRKLPDYYTPLKWAEKHWGLTAFITGALAEAGLTGDAPAPVAAALLPATEADNRPLDPLLYCIACANDAWDGYEYELNEAGDLACPNCGALAPVACPDCGATLVLERDLLYCEQCDPA